jgi:uncharacterized protein
LRKWIKSLLYLYVFAGFSTCWAGSYEDFFVAITRDDPSTINQLLRRGFDPNTRSPQGLDGQFLALREGSLKAAEALIDWPQTKPETRNADDESPLMMAALKGHTQLARKLVAKGADVNKTGWTPLHYAATHGHLEIMSLLLENHAYIDAESPNGTTPLMMAAFYGTSAAVKLLLDAGADARLKNQLGLTAIDFANKASRKDSADLIAASIRSAQPRGKW